MVPQNNSLEPEHDIGTHSDPPTYNLEHASSPGMHYSQVPGPSRRSPHLTPGRPATPTRTTTSETPPPRTTSPTEGDSYVLIRESLREASISNLPADVKTLAQTALEGNMQEIRTVLDAVIGSRFQHRRQRAPAQAADQQPARDRSTKRIYNYGRTAPSRDNRVAEYKKAQDLYERSRSTLVDLILRGETLAGDHDEHPSVQEVTKHFATTFETPSSLDNEPYDEASEARQVLTPILEDEIQRAKNGWRNTAPGPDGVSVAQIKTTANATLATIYNTILYTGMVPSAWKIARTILVHKDGDKKDPANWRPLTISSALMRLFHRVLASRIGAFVSLNTSQRGFRDVDGTMANCLILEAYIQTRRAEGKSHAVITVDIQKAFDSVSHWALLRALQRFRLAEPLVAYVMANITESTTTIKVGNQTTRPIRLSRGVKQGDPLSPILFNLVMDELLHKLERKATIGGTISPGIKVPALAFADDIVLLEDTEVKVPITLDSVVAFCQARGMKLNAKKCTAMIAVAYDKRIVIRTSNRLAIQGQQVRDITAADSFKYLGREYTGQGVMRPNNANLALWLSRIDRAPLKPDQKACIVRQYIIPKVLYGLQNAKVTGKVLREADRLIKYRYKRYLHLSSHTPDQYLYASVRDGGLGLTHLRHSIPHMMHSRITNLETEEGDLTLRHALQTGFARALSLRLQQLKGAQPPNEYWRSRIEESTFSRGLERVNDDVASRNWLQSKPRGWTGRDFVRAVQLRTNNLPTAGLPSNPPDQRRCRGGCAKSETLCHVLQGCPVTHHPRISRHNEIVRKLEGHCRGRGWNVDLEPHVRHQDGTLYRPDLVIHQDECTVVCDVQVSWDGDQPLQHIYDNKEAVYNNPKFLEAARAKWPGENFAFAPYILGARGILARCNRSTIELLQMGQPLKNSTVHSVLKWGSSIHSYFMRHVTRNAGAGGGWGSSRPESQRVRPPGPRSIRPASGSSTAVRHPTATTPTSTAGPSNLPAKRTAPELPHSRAPTTNTCGPQRQSNKGEPSKPPPTDMPPTVKTNGPKILRVDFVSGPRNLPQTTGILPPLVPPSKNNQIDEHTTSAPNIAMSVPDPLRPPRVRLTQISADSPEKEPRYLLSRFREPAIYDAARLYLAYLHDAPDDVCIKGETRTSVRVRLASEGLPIGRPELLGHFLQYYRGYGMAEREATSDLEALRNSLRTERIQHLQRARESHHQYFHPLATKK